MLRLLLVSTAFSGLTQRFYTELKDAGYDVSVELHHGNDDLLREGVKLANPDLIICPFLTRKIPEDIYKFIKCLIVHPGIVGDRGPSSLDWAIQEGWEEWGVTLLEADDEMDAGDIWATRNFSLRRATKSSIFNREVTVGAIECLWEALEKFQDPNFKPMFLDYSNPTVKGRLRPSMKQTNRKIDWQSHTTEEVLARINAADGAPGVLDNINGKAVFLHNAKPEYGLNSDAVIPGTIIATANGAICMATVDGAIWISHLKENKVDKSGIKLAAVNVLADLNVPEITIDYTLAGQQLPVQEVFYEVDGEAAYIHFPCHNGAMNTQQCNLLYFVYNHVNSLPVKAIVLMGGKDFFSNGIHLNTIEAAGNQAFESWENINAINNVVEAMIKTTDKYVVSAIQGNAGAGGVIVALAADVVIARKGVVLNPHYKSMGGLYGSEYWTYLLPKKLKNQVLAHQLTNECLPMGCKQAASINLVDRVIEGNHDVFLAELKKIVNGYIDSLVFDEILIYKKALRNSDEAKKPLQFYRNQELSNMSENFFGDDRSYHEARHRFVYKKSCCNHFLNIAKHRHDSLTEVI